MEPLNLSNSYIKINDSSDISVYTENKKHIKEHLQKELNQDNIDKIKFISKDIVKNQKNSNKSSKTQSLNLIKSQARKHIIDKLNAEKLDPDGAIKIHFILKDEIGNKKLNEINDHLKYELKIDDSIEKFIYSHLKSKNLNNKEFEKEFNKIIKHLNDYSFPKKMIFALISDHLKFKKTTLFDKIKNYNKKNHEMVLNKFNELNEELNSISEEIRKLSNKLELIEEYSRKEKYLTKLNSINHDNNYDYKEHDLKSVINDIKSFQKISKNINILVDLIKNYENRESELEKHKELLSRLIRGRDRYQKELLQEKEDGLKKDGLKIKLKHQNIEISETNDKIRLLSNKKLMLEQIVTLKEQHNNSIKNYHNIFSDMHFSIDNFNLNNLKSEISKNQHSLTLLIGNKEKEKTKIEEWLLIKRLTQLKMKYKELYNEEIDQPNLKGKIKSEMNSLEIKFDLTNNHEFKYIKEDVNLNKALYSKKIEIEREKDEKNLFKYMTAKWKTASSKLEKRLKKVSSKTQPSDDEKAFIQYYLSKHLESKYIQHDFQKKEKEENKSRFNTR